MYRVVWSYVYYCKGVVHKLSHKSFDSKGLHQKSGQIFVISPLISIGYVDFNYLLFFFRNRYVWACKMSIVGI